MESKANARERSRTVQLRDDVSPRVRRKNRRYALALLLLVLISGLSSRWFVARGDIYPAPVKWQFPHWHWK